MHESRMVVAMWKSCHHKARTSVHDHDIVHETEGKTVRSLVKVPGVLAVVLFWEEPRLYIQFSLRWMAPSPQHWIIHKKHVFHRGICFTLIR